MSKLKNMPRINFRLRLRRAFVSINFENRIKNRYN